MDGLVSHIAVERTVRIGGTNYVLTPLRVRDYAALEQRLLQGRRDPLSLTAAQLMGLDAAQQRQLLALAYEDWRRGPAVPAQELADWLRTPAGSVYRFWLALRTHQPQLTLEQAEDLLQRAAQESSHLIAAGDAAHA